MTLIQTYVHSEYPISITMRKQPTHLRLWTTFFGRVSDETVCLAMCSQNTIPYCKIDRLTTIAVSSYQTRKCIQSTIFDTSKSVVAFVTLAKLPSFMKGFSSVAHSTIFIFYDNSPENNNIIAIYERLQMANDVAFVHYHSLFIHKRTVRSASLRHCAASTAPQTRFWTHRI